MDACVAFSLEGVFVMDPQTASYYRAILFVDGQDHRTLPPTLVELHKWAVKRNQALGLGGMITKAVALSVAMTWLSSTKEGRAFTSLLTPLGDLFGECENELSDDLADDLADEPADDAAIITGDWDTLPAESRVVVTMQDKSHCEGQFITRRGSWVDVRVNGEVKHFRISKVKPVGV